jgi:hypothetical protein
VNQGQFMKLNLVETKTSLRRSRNLPYERLVLVSYRGLVSADGNWQLGLIDAGQVNDLAAGTLDANGSDTVTVALE